MSSLDAPTPRLTVWFDGGCPLCTREISLMQRLDRKGVIDFVDLQGDGTCPLDRATLLARFHAQEHDQGRDGPILVGAAAFAAMWRTVPLLRPLGLAARWRPLLTLLERSYVAFLRVRPALQRWMRRREQAAGRV
jgi:predicted DCC family thiol-disulfide oxidoreductase YuxK